MYGCVHFVHLSCYPPRGVNNPTPREFDVEQMKYHGAVLFLRGPGDFAPRRQISSGEQICNAL